MSIAERNIEEGTINRAPTSGARQQFRRPGEIDVGARFIAPSILEHAPRTERETDRKPSVKKTRRGGRDKSGPYMPLLFCLLLAIVVRVWLVIHTQGFIDGDEALVGIQAQHILHGEFPVYYYNQPYMGSLEAYLMAILFAMMGSSVWALRAEPILLSLVVVWLTWKLAGILADMAHLPPHAKRWFMTISALLAAIPPLYDTVVELRTLGGYIETFVLMLLLMISALQLVRRQHAGASVRELTWRWTGIGFIVGLGFWVNPLIISAVIVAGIWILWNYAWTGKRAKGKKIGFIAEQPTQMLAAISSFREGAGGTRESWANPASTIHETDGHQPSYSRGDPRSRPAPMNGQPQIYPGAGLLAGTGLTAGAGLRTGMATQRLATTMNGHLSVSRSKVVAVSPSGDRGIAHTMAGSSVTSSLGIMPGLGSRLSLDTLPTTILPALRGRSKLVLLLPFPALLIGCLLGLAPALLWGAAHQWQNFTYLFQLSGAAHLRPEVQAQYPTRLSVFFGLTQLYATCVGPRMIGGGLPGESELLAFLHTPMLILGAGCILITVLLVALSLPWRGHYRFHKHLPLLVSIRRLAALPLLFAAFSAVLFCATMAASIGLWSCQYDLAGRYASPLMLVLPFFFASIFVAIILFESRVHEKVASKMKHSTGKEKRHPTAPIISTLMRRLFSATAAFFRTQAILGVLVALLLFSLYMQVFSYGLTDSESTFQSPYCTAVPANNDPIIAYLQQEHIHYAWANNWLGYPIIFKTHNTIIVADPLPLIRQLPILNRIPSNTHAVMQADRPSMIAVVKQNDRYPLIEMILDIKNVTFHAARFPSVQGTDILVITPLSRTVSPFEAGDFYDVFQCSRNTQ